MPPSTASSYPPERDQVVPLSDLKILELDESDLLAAYKRLLFGIGETGARTNGERTVYTRFRLSGGQPEFPANMTFNLLEIKLLDKGQLEDPAEAAYHRIYSLTHNTRLAYLASESSKRELTPNEIREISVIAIRSEIQGN